MAWTKAKNGSNVTVSKIQAKDLLLKKGQGKHIELQLLQLNALKENDTLIIHRDIKPYWVVNVASFKNSEGRSITEKVRTSLPLFYIHDSEFPVPVVCFSHKADRDKTGFRADKRLEDKPFLPSISAYRYRQK